MKKKIYLVLFLVLIVFTLFLVHELKLKKEEFIRSSNEIESIGLRMLAYGSYKVKEYLNEAIELFCKQNSSLKVSLQVIPNLYSEDYFRSTGFIPGYEHLLLAEFAANDPPDLFFLPVSRGLLYQEAGALLELSEYLGGEKEQYNLSVGPGTACIASNSKNINEAVELMVFLHNYSLEYREKYEKAFWEESVKMPGDFEVSLDSSIEEFLLLWNQLALMKNQEKLILYPFMFKEQGKSYGAQISNGEEKNFLFVSIALEPDNDDINNISVFMKPEYIHNEAALLLFKDCVRNLIEVVDSKTREQGIEIVLTGLGAKDGTLNNLDFFNMFGVFDHNGIRYTTWGPDIAAGREYTLVASYAVGEPLLGGKRVYLK